MTKSLLVDYGEGTIIKKIYYWIIFFAAIATILSFVFSVFKSEVPSVSQQTSQSTSGKDSYVMKDVQGNITINNDRNSKSEDSSPGIDKNKSTVTSAPSPAPLPDANLARTLTKTLTRSGCKNGTVEFSGLTENHTKATENSHGMDATFLQITVEPAEAPIFIVQATGRGKGAREVAVARLAESVATEIKERSLCE